MGVALSRLLKQPLASLVFYGKTIPKLRDGCPLYADVSPSVGNLKKKLFGGISIGIIITIKTLFITLYFYYSYTKIDMVYDTVISG